MSESRKINIFGATGSIGDSTADVIDAHKEKFDVQVVSAHSNAEKLAKQAIRLGASYAVISDEANYGVLKEHLSGTDIKVAAGRAALLEYAQIPADISMMAIVGMAGLEPLMLAMDSSKMIALANKEPLVVAGPLVMRKAAEKNVKLLPVDSEHNAIFQVLDEARRESILRIILTASGGPFLDWSVDKMAEATKAQALAHPTWTMGAKISIDSATMMNKALEVIEAHYLFDMPAEKIDVIIHPQSIVHSMVEYCDGSVLAQMGASDMRTPIANVLSYPLRLNTPGKALNFKALNELSFQEYDAQKFPAIPLAYESLACGLYHSVAMNAGNEVAVDAFLSERISFGDIINCVRHTVESITSSKLQSLDDILALDEIARTLANEYINNCTHKKAAIAL